MRRFSLLHSSKENPPSLLLHRNGMCSRQEEREVSGVRVQPLPPFPGILFMPVFCFAMTSAWGSKEEKGIVRALLVEGEGREERCRQAGAVMGSPVPGEEWGAPCPPPSSSSQPFSVLPQGHAQKPCVQCLSCRQRQAQHCLSFPVCHHVCMARQPA